MSQHTAGPWAVDSNDESVITADVDGLFVAVTDTEDRSDDERAANARLIAAAPELLKALRLACASYEDRVDDTGGLYPLDREAWDACKAAIKKADGAQ